MATEKLIKSVLLVLKLTWAFLWKDAKTVMHAYLWLVLHVYHILLYSSIITSCVLMLNNGMPPPVIGNQLSIFFFYFFWGGGGL